MKDINAYMIIVTGGAGFIGSVVVARLNEVGRKDIIIVDELGSDDKWKNLVNLRYHDYIDKSALLAGLTAKSLGKVEAIVHMGACSTTTELDADYLVRNNYQYTKDLAEFSIANGVRFIYASSAATYGDGSAGYSDDDNDLEKLKPLNMYGYSKHMFDLYAKRAGMLEDIAGLKFFNVFGPNEYHKADMASVIYKAFNQITERGNLRLFKSDRDDMQDGEQRRDFVYVKDCADVILHLLDNPKTNGLFNLGTGQSRSFNDLAKASFAAMKRPLNIEYIPMPPSLVGKYQYFTEAKMDKLKAAGYSKPFSSLEDSVEDYIQNHLVQTDPYVASH